MQKKIITFVTLFWTFSPGAQAAPFEFLDNHSLSSPNSFEFTVGKSGGKGNHMGRSWGHQKGDVSHDHGKSRFRERRSGGPYFEPYKVPPKGGYASKTVRGSDERPPLENDELIRIIQQRNPGVLGVVIPPLPLQQVPPGPGMPLLAPQGNAPMLP